MNITQKSLPFYLLFCFFVIVSCSPESDQGPQVPTVQAVIDTPLPSFNTRVPAKLPTPVIVQSTVEPTFIATETPAPDLTAEIAPEEAEKRYRVVFVDETDTLNVRSGPGTENEIILELNPRANGIVMNGNGVNVNGSDWWPIKVGETAGWVNSRFLTSDIDDDDFCDVSELESLLNVFLEAISAQDDSLLAQSTKLERGLRIRRHWWNPEVLISGDELEKLFESTEIYDWGVADGSGDPIEGTFSEIIWPLLERDLIVAGEMACNEILSGGTAGIVQLPFPYEAINFYSLYRPAGPDEIEFNWGTWVVGIEQLEDSFFVSFLVHYEWEI